MGSPRSFREEVKRRSGGGTVRSGIWDDIRLSRGGAGRSGGKDDIRCSTGGGNDQGGSTEDVRRSGGGGGASHIDRQGHVVEVDTKAGKGGGSEGGTAKADPKVAKSPRFSSLLRWGGWSSAAPEEPPSSCSPAQQDVGADGKESINKVAASRQRSPRTADA